jgi:hypothetical protein
LALPVEADFIKVGLLGQIGFALSGNPAADFGHGD